MKQTQNYACNGGRGGLWSKWQLYR